MFPEMVHCDRVNVPLLTRAPPLATWPPSSVKPETPAVTPPATVRMLKFDRGPPPATARCDARGH